MKYNEWLNDNKSELIRTYAEECDLREDEVLDWYGPDFDKYCRGWFEDEQ